MRAPFLAAAITGTLITLTPATANAAAAGGPAARPAGTSTMVETVRRVGRPHIHVVRPGSRVVVRPGRYVAVRPWRHRPHYGTVVGGLVLGTIIAAAVANAAPPPPSSDLCWYWANRSHTRGYWDYCD